MHRRGRHSEREGARPADGTDAEVVDAEDPKGV